MKFDFTEGKWKVSEEYIDGDNGVIDQDNFIIADIPITQIKENHPKDRHWGESKEFYREISIKEQIANARAIACVPKLIDALIELVDLISNSGFSMLDAIERNENAKKAIEKATGKTWEEIS